MTPREVGVLAVGGVVILLANALLLRGTLAPLDQLIHQMDATEVNRSDRRLPDAGGGVAAAATHRRSFTMRSAPGAPRGGGRRGREAQAGSRAPAGRSRGSRSRAALEPMATELASQAGVEVRCRLDGTLQPLTPETELVLFRVAREALTNVARHADASTVSSRRGRRSWSAFGCATTAEASRTVPPGTASAE